MPRVLVVEDDELILDLVSTELRHEHYFVETATNGEAALQMLKLNDYDLLILDWNVPKVSGVDICRKLRFAGDRLPVLLMTGKTKTAEKVLGFDSGADDYLTKPFDVEELLVRAKALLRRASSNVTQGVLKVGGIELDVTAYQVTKDGTEIKLIPKEFAILETLMRYPNKIFSTKAIINRVWEIGEVPSSEAVRTHIKNLRRKLGDESLIETVHAVGYRFNTPSARSHRGKSDAVTN